MPKSTRVATKTNDKPEYLLSIDEEASPFSRT
ncbi:hypothetical protein SAMN05216387_101493 [Nitrosovibrio tenuis]|uniref:Uncharacterized protein n=1 Tax=Nitrosovibrio tenuis TaxID=1233 RepID=A0A1H7H7W0_9PROT|nr:hypothetical protein SAMN05216387_101493 [Nitrosovibrio tenuis]